MYFMKSVSRNSTCYFSDIKVNGNKRYWLPCCKYLVQVNPSNRISLYLISVLTGSGSGDVFVGQRLRHRSGGPTPRPGGRGMMGYTRSASCDKGNNSKQQTIKADWSPVQGSSFVNWCFCDKMCFQTDIVYMLCIVCMRFLTFNKQIIKQDVVLLLASILPQVHKEIPSYRLKYRQPPHIMMFMWYIMYHDKVLNYP